MVKSVQSMDWFKGKFTGKYHMNNGKIILVSGVDFPEKNQSIDSIVPN